MFSKRATMSYTVAKTAALRIRCEIIWIRIQAQHTVFAQLGSEFYRDKNSLFNSTRTCSIKGRQKGVSHTSLLHNFQKDLSVNLLNIHSFTIFVDDPNETKPSEPLIHWHIFMNIFVKVLPNTYLLYSYIVQVTDVQKGKTTIS